MMVDETNGVKYLVVVDGITVATRNSKQLAEAYILSLDEGKQSEASVVPVTNDNKEILLG